MEERRTNPKRVSLAIGRNETYIQQYLTKNVPKSLPESAREALGRHFNVDPGEFRREAAWTPSYLDQILFKLRCANPECRQEVQISIRGLVSKDSIICPICGNPIDLEQHKRAIEDLTRIAAALDKMAPED
jgi:hypothetical protein